MDENTKHRKLYFYFLLCIAILIILCGLFIIKITYIEHKNTLLCHMNNELISVIDAQQRMLILSGTITNNEVLIWPMVTCAS